MSNQQTSVLLPIITSVEQAEKLINESFAYGEDLDQAIAYLKEHDPQNDALKIFMGENGEVDVELLRAMNASAKYHEMKKNGASNAEELQKIANILNLSKNSILRKEAMEIVRELSANEEQAEQIEVALNETENLRHQNERNEYVRANTPALSDEEMEENAERMERLFSDANFQQDVLDGTVNRAKEEYDIADEDGNKTEEEKTVDFWGTLNLSLYLKTQALHIDDAGLKNKSDEDLKQEIINNFWGDVAQMAEASGSNDKKRIKANAFFASFFEKEEEAKHKAEMLREQGKTKAADRLQGAVNKFMDWSDEHLGTNPVRMAKTLWGYFSSRRGITNTLVGVAPTALALLGVTTTAPAIAAAMVTAGAYFALSPQRWTIEEKRRANLKAAKAKGSQEEIRMWSGLRGYNNARKAIKADEKENARYQRQRKWAWGIGGLYALAGSVIAPFAFGAEATKTMIATGAAVRASGGTANAGSQWYEAAKQNKEDKTEESAKAAKLARTYFFLGAAATTAMEVATVSNLLAAEHANEVATNPNALANDSVVNESPVLTSEPVAASDANAEALSADATVETPEVVVPKHYSSDMGIEEHSWNNVIMKYGYDLHETKYINIVNAQEDNPNLFAHADGTPMTPVEAEYVSQVTIEGLAKLDENNMAQMFDENHVPVFAKYKFFDDEGNEISATDVAVKSVKVNHQEAYFIKEDYQMVSALIKKHGLNSDAVKEFVEEHGINKQLDHYEYKNGELVTSNDIAPECWGSEERVEAFRALYHIVNCGDKVDGLSSEQLNSMYADYLEDAAKHGNMNFADKNICGEIHYVMHRHVHHHAPAAPIVHAPVKEVVIEPAPTIIDKPIEDAVVEQPAVVQEVVPQDNNVAEPVKIETVKPQDHKVDDGVVEATTVEAGRLSSHSTQLGRDENTVGQEIRNGNIEGSHRVVPGSVRNLGREVSGR